MFSLSELLRNSSFFKADQYCEISDFEADPKQPGDWIAAMEFNYNFSFLSFKTTFYQNFTKSSNY